jgi:cardiolipin synthase
MPLHNGEAAYPAMIEAIEQARNRVLLVTYILNSDRVGSRFANALESAVGRGVEVLVLVDGVGEMYSWRRASKALRKRGINAARFLPPRLLPPSIYLNLRNHRKLLIVDHDVAFAGGMNISDHHIASDEGPRRVSDVHFKLQGPIIDSLAEIFYRDWHFTTGEKHENDQQCSPVANGNADCRAIPDGPDGELDALALTIQSVVCSASESVEIMTPYFLPSRELIASLQTAALRGVSVRIVLPGKNNLFYIHWANRNTLTELLRWGIEAYYQPAPFCHSKILCVDQEYSLIGSANLDPRSLRLNYELGVEVFSTELCSELRAHFESVVAASEPIKYEQLVSRSVPTRLRDSAVALFSPYL